MVRRRVAPGIAGSIPAPLCVVRSANRGSVMQSIQPTKESVRAWLYGQVAAKVMPPSRDEIRRALGWPMTNKSAECAR